MGGSITCVDVDESRNPVPEPHAYDQRDDQPKSVAFQRLAATAWSQNPCIRFPAGYVNISLMLSFCSSVKASRTSRASRFSLSWPT